MNNGITYDKYIIIMLCAQLRKYCMHACLLSVRLCWFCLYWMECWFLRKWSFYRRPTNTIALLRAERKRFFFSRKWMKVRNARKFFIKSFIKFNSMRNKIIFTLFEIIAKCFFFVFLDYERKFQCDFLKSNFEHLINNFRANAHNNSINESLFHNITIFLITYNCLEMIKIKIMKK